MQIKEEITDKLSLLLNEDEGMTCPKCDSDDVTPYNLFLQCNSCGAKWNPSEKANADRGIKAAEVANAVFKSWGSDKEGDFYGNMK